MWKQDGLSEAAVYFVRKIPPGFFVCTFDKYFEQSFLDVFILYSHYSVICERVKFSHYSSTIHVSQFGGEKIKLIWIPCTCMILLTIIQSFFVFLFISISKIFFISSWLVYTYTPLPSNYGSFWCFHITQTIWSKIIYHWSNISSHLLHDKYWCEKNISKDWTCKLFKLHL